MVRCHAREATCKAVTRHQTPQLQSIVCNVSVKSWFIFCATKLKSSRVRVWRLLKGRNSEFNRSPSFAPRRPQARSKSSALTSEEALKELPQKSPLSALFYAFCYASSALSSWGPHAEAHEALAQAVLPQKGGGSSAPRSGRSPKSRGSVAPASFWDPRALHRPSAWARARPGYPRLQNFQAVKTTPQTPWGTCLLRTSCPWRRWCSVLPDMRHADGPRSDSAARPVWHPGIFMNSSQS